MTHKIALISAFFVVGLAASGSAQTVRYVDANADQTPHDGSDWCHAHLELYEALAVASSGDTIRVADGTYMPDTSGLGDPREATFQLINGVTLEGGYAGCGAPDPDARDFELYETILSGDLGTPDDDSDNSYHVVTGSSITATAVLDGFTITGGNANGSDPHDAGGGMYISGGSPTVINCVFSWNQANSSVADGFAKGGGMYISGGDPTVNHCVFAHNQAVVHGDGGYASGGGMWVYGDNPIVVEDCTFDSNTASHDAGELGMAVGGGIHGIATLINCEFTYNGVGAGAYTTAGLIGGGASLGSGSSVTNCTFWRNIISWQEELAPLMGTGAAVYADSWTGVSITNSTFTSNYGRNEFVIIVAAPIVTNCIVWDNLGGPAFAGWADVTYSCVQGGYAGEGNISDDPMFLSPASGDLRLGCFSPCVDAGNNSVLPGGVTTDLGGKPRFVDDAGVTDTGAGIPPIVDMGAYERQSDSHGGGMTIRVPTDFGTIEGAIDASCDADEIIVSPGTYNEAIKFLGKAITLRSADGPAVTTIDATGLNASVVTCDNGEGPDTVLNGFTITGGTGNPGPTYTVGGGMHNLGASPTVINCTFTGNWAGSWGGGMYNDYGAPTMTNCTFTGNHSSQGGGMYTCGTSTLINCTFTDNHSSQGGGLYTAWLDATVTNCIFWGDVGGEIYVSTGTAAVSYSCIEGGYAGTGNISDNPLFADGAGRLGLGSPCIDAADDTAVIVTTDLDGYPRILDGDADGTPIVDMGAYEYWLDCNNNGVPDDVDLSEGTSEDCQPNYIPDECDIAGETSEDCNANDVPDECDLAGDTSEDCQSNSVPDECDITEGTSRDCDSSTVPDECEPGYGDFVWIGPNGGLFDNPANWSPSGVPAALAQVLMSNALPTDNRSILDTPGLHQVCNLAVEGPGGGRQILQINDNCGLFTNAGVTIFAGGMIDLDGGELAGETVNNASGQVSGLGEVSADLVNQGVVEGTPGTTLWLTGSILDNQSTGSLTAPIGSVLSVYAPAVTQAGEIAIHTQASVVFAEALVNLPGGLITLLGGSLGTPYLTNEASADVDGFGTIDSDVTNDGEMTFVADTQIVGNLENNGTVTIQSGILTILGDLTGSGEIIGDFYGRDGTEGLTVIGDYVAADTSTLTLGQGVARIGGNFDVGINDPARYDLASATLQMIGLPEDGPQQVEVMATDVGNFVTLPDPSLFSLGTLRIGPTATTVQLADNHDNTPATGAEALYVENLILEQGTTLDLAGLCLYYVTVTPEDPWDPGSGVTVSDSVGGNCLLQTATAVPPAAEPGGPACSVPGDCTGAFVGADCVGGTCYIPKNRYLTIDPTVNEDPVAYQLEIVDAADYPTAVGLTWWVDAPVCYDYPNGDPVSPAPPTCEGADRYGWVASLTETAVTRVWLESPVNIGACPTAPVVTFEIRASADDGASFSPDGLVIGTAHKPAGDSQSWGDITGGPVEGMPGLWLAPERATNLADVQAGIRTFENRTEDTACPPRPWVDMEINQVINLADIQFVIGAFEGAAYTDLPDLDFIGVHPADCP